MAKILYCEVIVHQFTLTLAAFGLMQLFPVVGNAQSQRLASQAKLACDGYIAAYVAASNEWDRVQVSKYGRTDPRSPGSRSEAQDDISRTFDPGRIATNSKDTYLKAVEVHRSSAERIRREIQAGISATPEQLLAMAAEQDMYRCASQELARLWGDFRGSEQVRSLPSSELKPQKQEPLDASEVNQSLALVQQNQSRGDEQARKDGRKRNDSAYEAHSCLSPGDLDNPSSFGSLRNSCNYKVEFHFCVVRPNASAWSTAFNCEKQSFGGGSAGPGGRGPVQIKGAQSVLWFACRSPAIVVDQRYDAARGGVTGRCRVIGG